jgi:23S rRNA pseudouridine955/2504/2580 synthase
MREFPITPADEGRSVHSLLRNAMPTAPRSFLRRLPRGGAVTLDGAAPDPSCRLRAGNVALLRESGRVQQLLEAGPCPLDILFDDDDLLVLNKAAGLAVHPTESTTAPDLLTLAAALAADLGHRAAYHVINRLDRWTSGVVLLVPGSERSTAFARLFERREVDKRYVALVAGQPQDQGAIEAPVEGRPSRTTFTVAARGRGAALVLVHPETGRKHQIRQHFASIGHPLIGDGRYGGPANREASGALLHAVSIAFTHPVTGVPLHVLAPLPPHLRRAMDGAGIPPETLGALFDALDRPT